jgi:hypothetical protein
MHKPDSLPTPVRADGQSPSQPPRSAITTKMYIYVCINVEKRFSDVGVQAAVANYLHSTVYGAPQTLFSIASPNREIRKKSPELS